MPIYQNMMTRELAQHALAWNARNPSVRQLLYALAKRLEQEHHRANDVAARYVECEKELASVTQEYITHRTRAAALDRQLTEERALPRLGKPHIRLIHIPWYELRGFCEKWQWVCLGPQGTKAYGSSPAMAYRAWANSMAKSVTPYRRKI